MRHDCNNDFPKELNEKDLSSCKRQTAGSQVLLLAPCLLKHKKTQIAELKIHSQCALTLKHVKTQERQ